jgi:anti-sigma B factor antagonist
MQIQAQEHVQKITVVTLTERIDAFSAPSLRAQLETFLQEGATQFVLDMSDVPFLDSSGCAVAVSLLKRARMAGGDVKLVAPKAKLAARILHLTKFDRVFDMAETAEMAIQKF